MRRAMLAIGLAILIAGCGGAGSKTTTASCVSGFRGLVVTLRGPNAQKTCTAIDHAGQLAGWSAFGQPSLPSGASVGEACLGKDTHGNTATVQTTGADPTAPILLVDGVLATSGYQVAHPIGWGHRC